MATDLPHPVITTKNLEPILDLSGSMKLPLGKSTRIATARRVLRNIVAKIPDDFNVGLRVYGHRYGSRQKDTCTDSELVVPIQRLNRERLLTIVDSKQPRGNQLPYQAEIARPEDPNDHGLSSLEIASTPMLRHRSGWSRRCSFARAGLTWSSAEREQGRTLLAPFGEL